MISSSQATLRDEDVPVLIVGGSLVGLATSLFLSWHHIPSLLIERHAGISPLPRAGGFNARTMEIFRVVGMENTINQVVPPSTKAGRSLHVESLSGKELETVAQNIGGNESKLSPVRDRFIPQSVLEPLLQTRAHELESDLRFQTELVSFKQDTDGVCALIRDCESGEEHNVHARYLVAADGNQSAVREQLGIKEHGPGKLGHQVSIFFKADLREALQGRHIFLCYVTNPEVQGVLGIAQDGLSGGLVVSYPPDTTELEDNFPIEKAIAAVRAAVGQSDLPVEILGGSTWDMAALVAERFQEGNIFLVGDSAHVMPPSGGFGANTGISDAYNLAWKLAFVLNGLAGPTLLASYDCERRPVAEMTVEQAYVRSLTRLSVNPTSGLTLGSEERDHETVVFGYRYQSCAVFSEANEQLAELFEDPHSPSGHPGTRAPHVVLERNGQQLSTLDLLGQHFVLLTDTQGEAWRNAARDVSVSLDIALDVYQVGENADLVDVSGDFIKAYRIAAGGAILVRPDGYIAWRSQQAQSANMLKQIMALLLSRTEADSLA